LIKRHNLATVVEVYQPLHAGTLSQTLLQYDFGFAPLIKNRRNVEQGCYPLKILDYFAASLPLLASDLFVVKQTLFTASNAALFQANNRLSLKETLLSLIKNPTLIASMKLSAKENSQKLRTWSEYNEELQQIYLNL
jgi:glycosyltransferase involved in cell wall biosynthesis